MIVKYSRRAYSKLKKFVNYAITACAVRIYRIACVCRSAFIRKSQRAQGGGSSMWADYDASRLGYDGPLSPAGRATGIKRAYRIAFALMLAGCIGSSAAAETVSFQPIQRSFFSTSTDQTPVDIEIVGSTTLGHPHRSEPQPDRVLRLRIERAYITDYLAGWREQNASTLSLSIDRPTGLPTSLITVVGDKGRFHQNIPGVPVLAPSERVGRDVLITIDSGYADGSFVNYANEAAKCIRDSEGDDLWEMDLTTRAAPACTRGAYPRGRRWLAGHDGATPIVIECQERQNSVCSTYIDYGRFSVAVYFHQSHLHEWKDVIEFARNFLNSKRAAQ
jgi:hypothetical protein